MKRIILYLTALLLVFFACEKSCLEKKPKDVKPIDWENYNDVYTAFWNTYSACSESKNAKREIMVYGWAKHKGNMFTLVYETDISLPTMKKPNFKVKVLGLEAPIFAKSERLIERISYSCQKARRMSAN